MCTASTLPGGWRLSYAAGLTAICLIPPSPGLGEQGRLGAALPERRPNQGIHTSLGLPRSPALELPATSVLWRNAPVPVKIPVLATDTLPYFSC